MRVVYRQLLSVLTLTTVLAGCEDQPEEDTAMVTLDAAVGTAAPSATLPGSDASTPALPDDASRGDAASGAITTRETVLPQGCAFTQLPPHWVASDHSRAWATCDANIAIVDLEGGAPRNVAPVQDEVRALLGNEGQLIYLEGSDLKRITPEGGAPTLLASDVAFGRSSADDKHVVFAGLRDADFNNALFSVPAAGAPVVQLTDGAENGRYWLTSDGAWVVFAGTDDAHPLSVVATSGGAVRTLRDLRLFGAVTLDEGARFSHDLSHVALLEQTKEGTVLSTTIVVASIASGAVTELPVDPGFTVKQTGLNAAGSHAWVLGTDSMGPALLASPIGATAWRRFPVAAGSEVHAPVAKSESKLLVVALSETKAQPLTLLDLVAGTTVELGLMPPACSFSTAAMSADNARLPFIDAALGLSLADLTTGTVKTLVPAAISARDACVAIPWVSDDYSRVAYRSCTAATCAVALVDSAGQAVGKLSLPGGVSGLGISPESKLLLYTSSSSFGLASLVDGKSRYTRSQKLDTSKGLWVDSGRVAYTSADDDSQILVTIRP